MARRRLDDELIAQGFFRTRDDALRAVMAGDVSGASQRYSSAATRVVPGTTLHVRHTQPFVSRGGIKLEHGLTVLGVDPSGLSCLDVGCSTGGFTDCLLSHGARHVLSVDVGYAQFDWSLRQDPRVTLLERTNIVTLASSTYNNSIDLAVCDVSFTSVCTVLPAICALLTQAGSFLTLVKPQFEAPKSAVGEGGVVRDVYVRISALKRVANACNEAGLSVVGACLSPITGAKGNHEYLLLARRGCTAVELAYEHIVQ